MPSGSNMSPEEIGRVIEAMRSGTPVLASRIDGNMGLLGADYAGCFEPGDAADLAGQIKAARAIR